MISSAFAQIPFLFVFDIKAKDLRNQVNGKDQEENPKRITDGVSHANAGLCLRDKDFNIFLGKGLGPFQRQRSRCGFMTKLGITDAGAVDDGNDLFLADSGWLPNSMPNRLASLSDDSVAAARPVELVRAPV